MQIANDATIHATDAQLVCIIDHESVEAFIASHVAGCEPCTARAATLRSLLGSLSTLLRDGEDGSNASAPDVSLDALRDRARKQSRLRGTSFRARSHGWLSAAAVVLVCAGVAAAAVPSVREWIARHRAAEPVTTPQPIAARSSDNASTVSFTPASARFTIHFDAIPATGTLDIATVNASRSATIVRGSATEEVVVLPGELRIRNSPSSISDYRLSLPGSVVSLTITFGEGASGRDTVLSLSGSAQQAIQLGRKRTPTDP